MQKTGLVCLCLLAGACSTEPRTQVMVFLRAEPGVMERTTRLDVEVLGGAPGEARALRETVTYTTASSSEFFSLRWPRRVALVPEGGDPTREFAVVARAQDAEDEFARAEVVSGYLDGETLTLDVWLRDACIDQACGDGLTCERGTCVEAAPVDPCSLTRLEDGTVPEGCTPEEDAGRPDAGMDGGTDAGMDGGPDAGMDGGPDGGPPGPLDLYNVVFVASEARAPGSYGGISGAHTHCQDLARTAGLPEPDSYRAFLTDGSAPPTTLLTGSRGWVRPDGLPFADTIADISGNRTFYPVALTEAGEEPTETRVATGTSIDFGVGETCGDWTEMTGSVTTGNAFDGPRFWMNRRFGFEPRPPPVDCNTAVALYCFGTGRSLALPAPTPPTGAGRVFVTSNDVDSGAGISAFDAQCQTEGGASYVAFLPDSASGTPLARLAGFTGPWARADGVVVADSVTQLASEELRAPPVLDAFGAYVGDRLWSTGVAPSMTSGFNCTGWTAGGNARFSYTGRARGFYSTAVTRICDGVDSERVLCFSTASVD